MKISLLKTTIIRSLGNSRNERDRFYRLLGHEIVTLSRLGEDVVSSYSEQQLSMPEHVLVIGDTSEINTEKQKGRRKGSSNIGVLSDNKTSVFMMHVNIAVAAHNGLPQSITHIQSWQRPQQTESKRALQGQKAMTKPVANDPSEALL